ncbi:MAG: cell division protein FtsI, partial [Lachnospiraceae bacterium]|nr:cell division protein FtsI [Lachnospiraceae bacterium]
KKIVSPSGATVQNIEPRILRQTISETTSEKIREMCNLVVSGEKGTGKTARPAGYMIGGKTGTAETVPRSAKEYVVSFLGYAPVDDPQVAIYVVVDRPNETNKLQADAKFATRIVRGILTEVLPYMGIYMTEELSEKELEELEALQIELMTPPEPVPGEEEETPDEGTQGEGAEGGSEGAGEEEGSQGGAGKEEEPAREEPWKDFPIDPVTGYAVDPATGNYVDPVTGAVLGLSYEGGSANEGGPAAEPSPSPAA